MSVVPCCSCKILVLAIGDVLARPVVPVLLGQPEIDEEQLVAVAADAHQKIIRLNISANHHLGK